LDKAIVIYDGSCGFCKKWIARWRRITGDAVEYRSSAETGALFPEIPSSEFDRAVQLGRPSAMARLSKKPNHPQRIGSHIPLCGSAPGKNSLFNKEI